MLVQFVITEDDLRSFLQKALPARFEIDSDPKMDHWIELEKPAIVRLTQERGLTVRASAKVRWSVAGIDVPIEFRAIEVEMKVKTDEEDGGRDLHFYPQIVDSDIVGLPALIDRAAVSMINKGLATKPLVWHIVDMLHFEPKIGSKRLTPPMKLRIEAKRAVVKVSDGAITLVISGSIDPERLEAV